MIPQNGSRPSSPQFYSSRRRAARTRASGIWVEAFEQRLVLDGAVPFAVAIPHTSVTGPYGSNSGSGVQNQQFWGSPSFHVLESEYKEFPPSPLVAGSRVTASSHAAAASPIFSGTGSDSTGIAVSGTADSVEIRVDHSVSLAVNMAVPMAPFISSQGGGWAESGAGVDVYLLGSPGIPFSGSYQFLYTQKNETGSWSDGSDNSNALLRYATAGLSKRTNLSEYTGWSTSDVAPGDGTSFEIRFRGKTSAETIQFEGKTYSFATATYDSAEAYIFTHVYVGENALVAATSFSTSSIFTLGDRDDQTIDPEPIPLGVMTTSVERVDAISTSTDVDMYKFTVADGQRVAFDVDSPRTGGVDTYLRIFNSAGAQLAANDGGPLDGPPPREEGSSDPYLEYRFAEAGDYFVGVSSTFNQSYNAVSGEGDATGNTGSYALTVTPMTQLLTPLTGRKVILGRVAMPNPTNPIGGTHLISADVTLRLVTNGGDTSIEGNKETWIAIHGRNDNYYGFLPLALAIDQSRPNAQALVLDWSPAAADNVGPVGLEGAEWIPYVAQWVADVLKRLGVAQSQTYLVGHSWGSYVAHDIAADAGAPDRIVQPRREGDTLGHVGGIVALDPAREGWGYGLLGGGVVDFGAVSARSWAFYGDGEFGSASLAGTADESFIVSYQGGLTGVLNAGAKHSAPVKLFTSLVTRNNATPLSIGASLFDLQHLVLGTGGPWMQNVYSSSGNLVELPRRVFEGVFLLRDVDRDKEWGENWPELVSLKWQEPGFSSVTLDLQTDRFSKRAAWTPARPRSFS